MHMKSFRQIYSQNWIWEWEYVLEGENPILVHINHMYLYNYIYINLVKACLVVKKNYFNWRMIFFNIFCNGR